jgi:hypothetical protein
MKKIFIAAIIAAGMMACSEGTRKEQRTSTESSTTENNGSTEASSREKEIRDSTTLLDKKLADPNDPSTPDSLK